MKALYAAAFFGTVGSYTSLIAFNLLLALVCGGLGTYLLIWIAERR